MWAGQHMAVEPRGLSLAVYNPVSLLYMVTLSPLTFLPLSPLSPLFTSPMLPPKAAGSAGGCVPPLDHLARHHLQPS
jgi:hypothetical protein